MKKPILAFFAINFGIIDRGAEVTVYNLVKNLQSKYDIVIYARKRRPTDKTISSLLDLSKNIKIKRVISISKNNRILNFIYEFNPWLKYKLDIFFLNPERLENLTFSIFASIDIFFNHYDLIFPQNGIWGAICARIIRKLKHIPFMMRTTGGIEPPVVRQKPDVYVCETPVVYDWYRKNYPHVKFKLIPNGINTLKYSPQIKAIHIKLQQPIYLCVGALIPAKRIELAILAVSGLKQGSLVVLGVGPLLQKLKNMGKDLLGNKRFLLTDVPHNQTPKYYKCARVFTLPSYKEPFGNVYLEAMAIGLPIVAPNDRQRRFIIGKAGILCNVGDLKIYTKTLFKASQKNFKSKPRTQAMKFNWTIVAEKYRKTIDQLLNEYK